MSSASADFQNGYVTANQVTFNNMTLTDDDWVAVKQGKVQHCAGAAES